MMNRIMMEDKLDGSSKLSSWKPRLQGYEDINISTLSGIVPTNYNAWLIDGGASRHMTSFRDHLTNFVEKETHLHVVLGDDARYNVKGVRTSTFQLDSDMQIQLREVLYVLGMKRNLVSISVLDDKGYKVTFLEGRFLAWHKDSHINSAKVIDVRENILYRLTIISVEALLHDTISLSELCHRRLAHVHYRALPALGKMVTCLPKMQIQHKGVCKGCALGKNFKGSFLSSDNRSKEILDLIHSDVCGPMIVASLNVYLYYVLFIDDHSRKTWIYFLKNKDGVLTNFQEFKVQVEKLTRRKIKVLRLDNGGEYTSKYFSNFCIEAWIKREFTVTYNPQQNGVAERKNRTIIEATKAMIHDQSLPMTLWAESCMIVVYVQNMSPYKILKNITLEEAFTGVKPEIGHFRIFGCSIYFHVPKEKRSKLDPSRRKGTFVGYNESSKAYQIYIPDQRQIEISRDVTFEEEIAFQKSRESRMEIYSETMPSPPSTVQRETNIVVVDLIAPVVPADPIAPFDMPGDITVGHKRLAWARQTLQ
jgi:transposase InsO family protein